METTTMDDPPPSTVDDAVDMELVVGALLDHLVEPLLDSSSDANPSLFLQQSVAKQIHAVVLLYNYYHRKQFPEHEYLHLVPFCKVAVNVKPSLLAYMREIPTLHLRSLLKNQLTVTEKLIFDACNTCISLDASRVAPTMEGWPISKIAILVIDSTEENCLLLPSFTTEGVWSPIERKLDNSYNKSVNKNKRRRTTKSPLGDNLNADNSGFQRLAFASVKETKGIDQKDLIILENHTVYSLSEDKTSTLVYVMKCTKAIQVDTTLVPIRSIVDSLKGPLVQNISGNYAVCQVVGYFQLLPYADIFSDWLSRELLQNNGENVKTELCSSREKPTSTTVDRNMGSTSNIMSGKVDANNRGERCMGGLSNVLCLSQSLDEGECSVVSLTNEDKNKVTQSIPIDRDDVEKVKCYKRVTRSRSKNKVEHSKAASMIDKLQVNVSGKSDEMEGVQEEVVRHKLQIGSLEKQVSQLRGCLEEKGQRLLESMNREKQVQASLATAEITLIETKKHYDLLLESKQLDVKEICQKNDQAISDIRERFELEKLEIANFEKEKAIKLLGDMERKCDQKLIEKNEDLKQQLMRVQKEHSTLIFLKEHGKNESDLTTIEELKQFQLQAQVDMEEKTMLLRLEHDDQMAVLKLQHNDETQKLKEELTLLKSEVNALGKSEEMDGVQEEVVRHKLQIDSLEQQVVQLRDCLEEKEQRLLESMDREKQVQVLLATAETTVTETKKHCHILLESKQLDVKECQRNDQAINDIRERFELEKLEIINFEKEKAVKLLGDMERNCDRKLIENVEDLKQQLMRVQEEHATLISHLLKEHGTNESDLATSEELIQFKLQAQVDMEEKIMVLRKEHDDQMKVLRHQHNDETQKLKEELALLKSELVEHPKAPSMLDKLQAKVLGKSEEIKGFQEEVVNHELHIGSLEKQVSQLRGCLEEKEQHLLESMDREKQVHALLVAAETTLAETKKHYDLMLESKQLDVNEICQKNDQAISNIREKFELEKLENLEIINFKKEKAVELHGDMERNCDRKLTENEDDLKQQLVLVQEEHTALINLLKNKHDKKELELTASHIEELKQCQFQTKVGLEKEIMLLKEKHDVEVEALSCHYEDVCRKLKEELEFEKSKISLLKNEHDKQEVDIRNSHIVKLKQFRYQAKVALEKEIMLLREKHDVEIGVLSRQHNDDWELKFEKSKISVLENEHDKKELELRASHIEELKQCQLQEKMESEKEIMLLREKHDAEIGALSRLRDELKEKLEIEKSKTSVLKNEHDKDLVLRASHIEELKQCQLQEKMESEKEIMLLREKHDAEIGALSRQRDELKEKLEIEKSKIGHLQKEHDKKESDYRVDCIEELKKFQNQAEVDIEQKAVSLRKDHDGQIKALRHLYEEKCQKLHGELEREKSKVSRLLIEHDKKESDLRANHNEELKLSLHQAEVDLEEITVLLRKEHDVQREALRRRHDAECRKLRDELEHQKSKDLQAIKSPKMNQMLRVAARILEKKRDTLSVQQRCLHDEVAQCEKTLQTLLSGGQEDLMSKVDSTVEACDDTLSLGVTQTSTEQCQNHVEERSFESFKRRKLSESTLSLDNPCQELDNICCENNWILPMYTVLPSKDQFRANVMVRGKDFVHSVDWEQGSNPLEARVSAARQMLIKLRSIESQASKFLPLLTSCTSKGSE